MRDKMNRAAPPAWTYKSTGKFKRKAKIAVAISWDTAQRER
jgi:hypothetical protein